MKKLYKSKTNRVFTGVIGGLGDYFSMDATVLRLFWVVIVLCTGVFPGVIAYIIGIFIVPEQPDYSRSAPQHTAEAMHSNPGEHKS